MKYLSFFFCFVLLGQLCGADEVPWYNPVYEMRGTVVDEAGNPVPNILISEPGADESEVSAVALTDAEGNFTFTQNLRQPRLLAENADRSLLGTWTRLKATDPFVLKPARTITGTVKDGKGEPIPDALVIAVSNYQKVVKTLTGPGGEFRCQFPADITLQAVLAMKDGDGFDYIWTSEKLPDVNNGPFALTLDGVKPVQFRCLDDSGQPLAGVRIRPGVFRNSNQPEDLRIAEISPCIRTTDADGNAVFDDFPLWQKEAVTFNAHKNGFLYNSIELSPEDFEKVHTVRMRRAVTLRGTLRFPDGTPAPYWRVRVNLAENSDYEIPTDQQGRFEAIVASNRTVHLQAEQLRNIATQLPGLTIEEIDKDWVAAPQLNIATGSDPILVHDITLEKGTRISGHASLGADNKPVPHYLIMIHCLSKEGEKFSRVLSYWQTQIGADSTYEFWAAPGHYELELQCGNRPTRQITVEKGVEQTINLHAEEAKTARKIRGKVIFGDDTNNTVPGALVSYQANDVSRQATPLETDENGHFEITALSEPVYIEILTPDKRFGKMVIVQPTGNDFTVSLELTASVRGKVIDVRSKTPPVGRVVVYSIYILRNDGTILRLFQRETETDENGEYEFQELPTGIVCSVLFPKHHYGEEFSHGSSYIVQNLNLQPGEDRVLRDYTFDSRPSGYSEYYFQLYNAYAGLSWDQDSRLEQRFELLLKRTKRDNKRGVFAVLIRDKLEKKEVETLLQDVYATLFSDDLFALTERFYMMCFLMQPEEGKWHPSDADMAREFVETHKVGTPLPTLVSVAFFDADGNLLGVEPLDHTAAQRKQGLIEMLEKY